MVADNSPLPLDTAKNHFIISRTRKTVTAIVDHNPRNVYSGVYAILYAALYCNSQLNRSYLRWNGKVNLAGFPNASLHVVNMRRK